MKKTKRQPIPLYKDSNYTCSFQRDMADIEQKIPKSLRKLPLISAYTTPVTGTLSIKKLEKIFDQLMKNGVKTKKSPL